MASCSATIFPHAESDAEPLASAVSDPQSLAPERKIAWDDKPYTYEEYQEHYGTDELANRMWQWSTPESDMRSLRASYATHVQAQVPRPAQARSDADIIAKPESANEAFPESCSDAPSLAAADVFTDETKKLLQDLDDLVSSSDVEPLAAANLVDHISSAGAPPIDFTPRHAVPPPPPPAMPAHTTLEDAIQHLRECKAPPGKKTANACLKQCRRALAEVAGAVVDVDEVAPFHWRAYLARHPQHRQIFSEPVLERFWAEVFPETDPSTNDQLRVDFVCQRLGGSAVRLHPHKDREATITIGCLRDWRLGRAPVYCPNAAALHVIQDDPPRPPS